MRVAIKHWRHPSPLVGGGAEENSGPLFFESEAPKALKVQCDECARKRWVINDLVRNLANVAVGAVRLVLEHRQVALLVIKRVEYPQQSLHRYRTLWTNRSSEGRGR